MYDYVLLCLNLSVTLSVSKFEYITDNY